MAVPPHVPNIGSVLFGEVPNLCHAECHGADAEVEIFLVQCGEVKVHITDISHVVIVLILLGLEVIVIRVVLLKELTSVKKFFNLIFHFALCEFLTSVDLPRPCTPLL